jgi:hypothetical protein
MLNKNMIDDKEELENEAEIDYTAYEKFFMLNDQEIEEAIEVARLIALAEEY